jgi:hypothetical protein
MKTVFLLAALTLAPSVTGFTPAIVNGRNALTQRSMFGGGGEGAIKEDDPEKRKAIEQAAKAMGVTVEEYQVGMNARLKFEKELTDMKVTGGNNDIGVECDGRVSPDNLVIKISEAGKAKGKEAVSTELASAFKKVSETARTGRAEAQKTMMKFIQDQMKA